MKWTTNVNNLEIRSHKNLITVVWANEVRRLLTNFLLSNVSLVTRSCFSRTAHQCIGARNNRTVGAQNPRFRLSGPPTALTSIWSITSSGGSCNSGSIRRRSRMWMNSSQEIWIGLEQNIIDTAAINAWRNRLRACVRAKCWHIEHWL